jgi:hypothetical protein
MEKSEISEFLSPADIQKMFKISKVTEIKWRRSGALPSPLILGKRIYYRVVDIQNLKTA